MKPIPAPHINKSIGGGQGAERVEYSKVTIVFSRLIGCPDLRDSEIMFQGLSRIYIVLVLVLLVILSGCQYADAPPINGETSIKASVDATLEAMASGSTPTPVSKSGRGAAPTVVPTPTSASIDKTVDISELTTVTGRAMWNDIPITDTEIKVSADVEVDGEWTPAATYSTTFDADGYFTISFSGTGTHMICLEGSLGPGYKSERRGCTFEVESNPGETVDIGNVYVPKAMTMLTPMGPTSDVKSPTFSWEAFPEAVEYYLSIQEVSTGNLVFSDFVGAATEYVPEIPFTANIKYQSRVSAYPGSYVLIAESDFVTFNVGPDPNSSAKTSELTTVTGTPELLSKDNVGETALHAAARDNSLEVATLLIDSGADIEAKNEAGETPLHYAAWQNSLEVAQLLIDSGADINAKDNDGNTALHWAALRNHFDFATLLINRGADINAKTDDGKTALHRAAKYNLLEVATLLIDRGANTDGIDLSWMPGFSSESTGAEAVDSEAKDNVGDTSLHDAAKSNSLDLAILLIDSGVDIEGKDNGGRTALWVAAMRNALDVATLLIDRGANIEAKNNWGEVILWAATANNSLEVATLLIDRGANIEAKDHNGETALHRAAKYNLLEVAILLIDRGANREGIDLSWMN